MSEEYKRYSELQVHCTKASSPLEWITWWCKVSRELGCAPVTAFWYQRRYDEVWALAEFFFGPRP